MNLLGIVIPAVLIVIFLTAVIISWRQYSSIFDGLNKDKHGLKFLYPLSFSIYHLVKDRLKCFDVFQGSQKEKEKLRAVYMDCDTDKYTELIRYKNLSYILISIFISLLFIMGINMTVSGHGFITKLSRQDLGGTNSLYSIDVIGLTDDRETIELDIKERVLSENEVNELFTQICETLPDEILNGNKSPDLVYSDLYLPEEWKDTGISISWSSSDTGLIDGVGKVNLAGVGRQGKRATLTAWVNYMDYSCESRIDIRVIPQFENENQYLVAEFSEYIRELESGSKAEAEILLPENYKGKKIKYSIHKEYKTYYILPVLILIIGVLKVFSEKENIDKKWRKRNNQLVIDYSEIVSKLSVLVSAGLTIRSAWERIAKDYEAGKLKKKSLRYVYEEMLITQRMLEGGVSEIYAYEEFGQRCGIHNYIKLGNLLSQSVRKGYRGLSDTLQKEAIESFEERKNIARKQGEEAGVKLLFPMMMLFGIVLIVLVVPAFMNI